MNDKGGQQRRRRRASSAQGAPTSGRRSSATPDPGAAPLAAPEAPAEALAPSERPESPELSEGPEGPAQPQRHVQPTAKDRRPLRQRPDQGERALRELTGAGKSQLGVQGALRGRDVNRPTEADLAEAERDVVLVRRHWTPSDNR